LRDAVVVAASTSAIVVLLFRLWDAPIRVPFLYRTDGISQLADIKGILDNGWYQHNPLVGFPVGLDHRDFSLGSDNLQYAYIKVLGFFTHDAVLVSNLYYFISFVLVALVAFFVVRYFKVSRRAAFVVALLYTFLPYHFLRGTWHLQLAAYYTVPIACLLTVLVWRNAPPFFTLVDDRPAFCWRDRRAIWFVVAAIVIAMTGVYYMAFCIVLMLSVGGLRLLTTGGTAWRPLAAAAILTGVMVVTTVINTAPSLLYWREHGKNDEVATRTVQESDYYALRPIQMLSPIPGHRIDKLATIDNEVLAAPNNSEATQFLGVVGALGFLGLMVVLLGMGGLRARSPDGLPLPFCLASLSALAVLYGVTGGLSWIIGLGGLTEIRSWNRISIFIAFYALLAVGLALDRFVGWLPPFRHKREVAALGAVIIVALGILDQTSSAIVPKNTSFEAEWNSDARFVHRIERTLGPGAAVFQLPYLPFPEAIKDLPPYGMQDYDPFRGYLHSDSLKWSYGAIRGRAGDWQREVVKQPVAEMLDAVVAVGFRGLWIDRFGYPKEAREIEARITDATGEEPIQSPNGRFSFVDLRPYAREISERLGPEGVRKLRERTLRDVG
jgi:phosphoglycerol transferase